MRWLAPTLCLLGACAGGNGGDEDKTDDDGGTKPTDQVGDTVDTRVDTSPGPTGATADSDTGFKTGGGTCWEVRVGAEVPYSSTQTTKGADNNYTPQCGGPATPDIMFQVFSIVERELLFEIRDDGFDAVLYLLQDCGGPEIGCANETTGGPESLRYFMNRNETILVGVEGISKDQVGEFELEISVIPQAETNCADGIDEDLDELTDCFDDDCVGDKACAEDCDDGKDNNENGVTDCDDTLYCLTDPACFEDCENGVDDNDNDLVDCDDKVQCNGSALCNAQCPDITLPATVPATVTGNTITKSDDVSPSCGEAKNSGDLQYTFAPKVAGTYIFDTVGTEGFSPVLSVIDSCGGKESECNDDWQHGQAQVKAGILAGGSVIINVDGVGGTEGEFVLNIAELEAAESDCSDGRDLDNDGLVDCVDDDCDAKDGCEEVCGTGIDEDVDGDVDCEDLDCVGDEACEEDCTNGKDDNNNNLVDCDDPNCRQDKACRTP